jgi:sporulation protein YlmC with PRC-barrel domain
VKPTARLRLAADLRDLQIVDADGCNCGIVDDIELDGKPGGGLAIAALLVGPGAYRGRLPAWLAWLVARLGGKRIVRVPWSAVARITSVVTLDRGAGALGLDRAEKRAERLLIKYGGRHPLR